MPLAESRPLPLLLAGLPPQRSGLTSAWLGSADRLTPHGGTAAGQRATPHAAGGLQEHSYPGDGLQRSEAPCNVIEYSILGS